MQSSTAHRGVVPFENSSNGSVVFTLDLFADLARRNPDILVCGEAYIAVQHCLVGRALTPRSGVIESPLSSGTVTPTTTQPAPQKPAARPVADLQRIAKLYSHPQAWGQCNAFLNTYLKGVERHDVSSTSRAAQLVAQDKAGTSAAVSSAIAARIHGLDVLARGIEDRGDNMTRFFVLRKRDANAPDSAADTPPASSSTLADGVDAKNWKTLISFTVDHANAGSLAQSLAAFAKHGLNLTSINTRPSGTQNWNYIFFVELQGRREGGGAGAVNAALRELDGVCRAWRWLGSWESGMR